MFGPIATAVGSLAGSIMDRQESRHSAKQQYVYNSWLQNQNQEFQKYMAQNAHQMEIEDLKKSGLNPVLSAQGSTAGAIAGSSSNQGTSPGTTASNFATSVDNMAKMITATSGQDLNEKMAEKALAETNNINENSKWISPLARAKVKNDNSQTAKNTAELGKIESEIKKNRAEEELKQQESIRTKKGISGYTFGTDPDAMDTALNVGILGAGALGLGMSSAKDFAGSALKNALRKRAQKKYGEQGYDFRYID